MVSEENANQEVISQQEENTPSPGAMLKARREKLGLSQQDIADKLFLKSKQINDLENDVIDEKSSVTFTKGYVRNYAKQLGMNSHEVIEAFERYHNQTSVPSSEKLQSFSKRVAKQTHEHKERPFFGALVDFMTSGPVMVQVLEGENAVLANREIMGATNPADAAAGTLRSDYAASIDENAVHGSDAPESAAREIAYFFSEEEICPRTR